MSSSESAEKSIIGLWGGVFSNPEWLFVLVVVESVENATSNRIGSAGMDSDGVSSCSEICASNIRFASMRVIGRRLDMQPLRFVVRAQMCPVCQKCYPSRKHGARPILVKGSRLKVTMDCGSVVIDRQSRKRRCVLGCVERGSDEHCLRSTTRYRRNTAQHIEDTQRYARQIRCIQLNLHIGMEQERIFY